MYCPKEAVLTSKCIRSFQADYFRLVAAPWTEKSRQAIPGAGSLLPLELPALHHCVQSGDLPKTLLAIMASSPNINEMDEDDMTPLHWACARGHKRSVAALLSNARLNTNAGVANQHRPIHTALEWLSRWAGGATFVELPLMILKDSRTDVNAAGVYFLKLQT